MDTTGGGSDNRLRSGREPRLLAARGRTATVSRARTRRQGGNMTEVVSLGGLRELVHGEVIGPADPGYDKARSVYNGMIDKRPGAVVRVADTDDVIACVKAARDADVDLAIRGGGHSGPGVRHLRRRHRHRLLDPPRRPGRPGPDDRARAGGLHMGRLQPCDPRVRTRDHRRHHLHNRRRRPDARRWDRLPHPPLRAVV